MARLLRIAALLMGFILATSTSIQSQSCQAVRIQNSILDFSGSPVVTMGVGGYPKYLANGLEAAADKWNTNQACSNHQVPDFSVDRSSTPPTSTTNNQLKVVFRANDPAPFDSQRLRFIAAQVNHTNGFVEIFGACPAPQQGVFFPFCNSTGTKIAWGSNLGITVLAHELGHTLRIDHDACSNSIMQLSPSTSDQILPAHCDLADQLHDVVSVSMTITGITPTSSSQSGTVPEEVRVNYQYSNIGGGFGAFNEQAITQDQTIQLPNLPKAWSATFSAYHLNPNKTCDVQPPSVQSPTSAVSVQVTCTCTTSNLEALGVAYATTTDCPYDFPQDITKFEPFLPMWPVFDEPWPWYLSNFGPFSEENPAECERQTVCTEGPQVTTIVGGETIVTQVLTCTDQCVAAATIDLHGPSTKITFPGGDHAGDGTLSVDGYAVDAEGLYDLKFYVDNQPVTLSGLQKNLYRPEACTEVQGANRTNCSQFGGFQGTLDATWLSEGTHQFQVVALDSRTGYPMATLAEKPFTVPSCFDSTRPSISITSPTAGSTVSGTVSFSASASDDVGVTRVALFVDGVRVANDFTAPYTYSWDTTSTGNGDHTLMARAFDACGNWRGTQRTVTVNNFVPCQATSTTLCFQSNRFSAQVSISGQNGITIPFSNSGGFYRLADPANVEVALKVLDGRTINGRFWVYHGSLTTQPYTVTVTDHVTGRVRTYNNSGLCGGADTSSFLDALWYDLAVSSGTCAPTTTSACLQGSRFRVEVLRSGSPQRAYGATSKTASFGFGSVFDPEVVVKVLDGRAVNNRYWVFYGSLTNQSYTVRVTDTVTGIVKLYNPPAAFCGNADTSAF